jgi:hypothetical protein
MANNEVEGLSNAPILHSSVEVESGISCKCCEGLKVELKKVLLELSAAREIIRVLQESGNYGGRVECENTNWPKVYQEETFEMNKENVSEWMRVTKGYERWARKLEAKKAQALPTCVNCFSELSNLHGPVVHVKEQRQANSRPVENRKVC